MIQKTLLTIILVVCSAALSAQTLKVTSTDGTEPKLTNYVSREFLGKELELNIYDNSATVKLPRLDRLILRYSGDNTYRYTELATDKESDTFILTVNKTLGIVTSVNLKFDLQEKVGQKRNAYWILTAKRF